METLPTTKPYLLRALWEWCNDSGFTPYLVVEVDEYTQVPREYIKDGQIVLNLGGQATGKLQMGNDTIEFQARFAGVARQIIVPVARVSAIYAKENGAGMVFDVEKTTETDPTKSSTMSAAGRQKPTEAEIRPKLQRIK